MTFRIASPEGQLLQRAISGARRAVGRYGLVGRCRKRGELPGVPTLPVYVALGPRRDLRGRKLRGVPVGTGVAELDEHAWLKAVVEALERYCLVWPDPTSPFVRAPLEEIEDVAVPLDRFALFSAEQYGSIASLRRPGAEEPVDWAWAWSLTRGCMALVPAALAHGAAGSGPPNNYTRGISSTGTACHVSLELALLAGIEEVVERDAVMISWLHRRVPNQVTLDDRVPADLRHVVDTHLTLSGLELVLLDLTLDSGIPTIACLGRSEDPSRPAAVLSSASRLDPVEATRKALFEIAQILSSLAIAGCGADSSLAEVEVRSFEDHARFYSGAAAAEGLRYLCESPTRVPLSGVTSLTTGSAAGDLKMAVSRLATVGLEVLAVDLTTPDVASLGFRTVKVLVPGAVDVNADVRFPHLGSPRISSVPEALGWTTGDGDVLNLAPCPLP